jgi:hypothetical protein
MTLFKKISIAVLTLILAVVGYFYYALFINPKSPQGTAVFDKDDLQMEVTYYRPYKNGRLIFGDESQGALLPYGKYWRLGANLATKIDVNQAITFAGIDLEAGSYRLYAYPQESYWELIIHTNSFGSSAQEPDPEGIIARINLEKSSLNEIVEQFTITFEESPQNILLRIRWDTTEINIPIN